MHEIRSEQLFQTTISAPQLTVVDFAAKWCGPCKMLGPKLEAMTGRYPSVRFIKVDVDSMDALAAKYQISAMPTILFFRKGLVVGRVMGADDHKIEEMVKKLSK